jgi:hypothetical protein
MGRVSILSPEINTVQYGRRERSLYLMGLRPLAETPLKKIPWNVASSINACLEPPDYLPYGRFNTRKGHAAKSYLP